MCFSSVRATKSAVGNPHVQCQKYLQQPPRASLSYAFAPLPWLLQLQRIQIKLLQTSTAANKIRAVLSTTQLQLSLDSKHTIRTAPILLPTSNGALQNIKDGTLIY